MTINDTTGDCYKRYGLGYEDKSPVTAPPCHDQSPVSGNTEPEQPGTPAVITLATIATAATMERLQ